MPKSISTATRSACALASLASAYMGTQDSIDKLNLLTAKGAQCLAFDMVGATIAELNTALAAIKPTIPALKVKGFDQLLRRHVLPVLAQENKAPYFLYNANNGKKGSFATFHDKPQTLKGKANPKQLTAKGKAPLPSMESVATVEQLAAALPTVSPAQALRNALQSGALSIKEATAIIADYAQAQASKPSAASIAASARKSQTAKTKQAVKTLAALPDNAMVAAMKKALH